MINLLPPDIKENFKYARRNTVLRRWVLGMSIGVWGMVIVVGGGWFFLNRSITSYTTLANEQKAQLKAQNLDDAKKEVETISNNLKLVVNVLSREVLFSKLLTQIGAALPRGSVLTNLDILQIDGGIDLQAATKDYQTASQLQVNLQNSETKIFTKADLVSIQCQNSSATTGFSAAYPCKVSIRAQFASDNQFLFINNINSAKKATP